MSPAKTPEIIPRRGRNTMTYTENLIKKITNKENWPSFKRANFLQELNNVADESIRKNTIEGCLAAILIYHQLCEEIIKFLIECSDFFIQISIYPAEICYNREKTTMFGKLLLELEKCPSFENKKQLIDKCRELNQIRIRIVHKLTIKSSLSNIKKQTKKVNNIYEDIFRYFETAREDYFLRFHSIEKDDGWRELVNYKDSI